MKNAMRILAALVGILLVAGGALAEAETPAWTEPQPNNLLLDFCNDPTLTALFDNLDANPPVEMLFYRDQMEETVVTDVDEMLSELQSFRSMRVGEPTDEMWCDAGSAYTFTFADGQRIILSFNAPGIFEWHGHNYRVLLDDE